MKKNTNVGSDNIFEDLGIEDSEEMKIRSDLMSETVNLIRKSGLKNKEIAVILGITPQKVSALMTGKINNFSNDTLIYYLTLLGVDIEIRLRPLRKRISKTVKKGAVKIKKPATRRRKTKTSS